MKYMRTLVCTIVVTLAAAFYAVGQTTAEGTVIVINSSQSELVFAADSREVRGMTSYTDDDCKLSALGPRVIFAASGRGGLRNKLTHKFVWNVHTVAKGVYASVSRKPAPERLTEKLADDWGVAVKKELEADLSAVGPAFVLSGVEDDHTLALGAFAAIEKNGTIGFAIEKITYDATPDGKTTINAFVDYTATAPFSLYFMGKGEILREFYANATSRSNQWNRDMEMGLRLERDPVAFRAQKLVQLSIDNYPPTRTANDGSRFSVLGGPLVVVKLTPTGIEWIQSGPCKAQVHLTSRKTQNTKAAPH